MNMKKIKLIFAVSLLFTGILHAKVINDGQILPPDSQIYKDFINLQANTTVLSFTNNTPLSVSELKFFLNQYNYDSLDDYGRYLYDNIYNELYEKEDLLKNVPGFSIFLHPKLNLEFYYKTNKNIPWSYNYYFKDNFISSPIDMGFGENFAMGGNFFLGKNYIAASKPENFWNYPLKLDKDGDPNDVEFYFPTFAYCSFGKAFDNWGFNFHSGKQGKSVGQTLTGSIIYNKTFETDAYFEFDIYSPVLKFTMDVVQVSSNRHDNIQTGSNTERYLYIHQFDIRFFKKLKLTLMEASLVVNPFSLRFLNPIPFMHQFGGWTNYITTDTSRIYREANFCADFAYMFEYTPVKNLRLYGIYNQIEMQLPYERGNSWGRYYPNSIGFQFGVNYNFFFADNSSLGLNTEFIYNSPFMYIKQTPSASLYRMRIDMQTKKSVYSWIGSPYGPDCIGGVFDVEYKQKKFTAGLNYSLFVKGENDFTIFNSLAPETEYYDYYPSVEYKLHKEGYSTNKNLTDDELYKKAISLKPSGKQQISNSVSLRGAYYLNEHFEFNGKILFDYINQSHKTNKNEFGVEFDLSISYKVF